MRRRTAAVAVVSALFCISAGSACQEVEQPSPMLTKEQMEEVNKHIYDYAFGEEPPEGMKSEPKQAPKPEYSVGANYQDKIRFIGFSVGNPDENDPIVAGETTTIRWYWQALEEMDENWKIFVHFDSKETDVENSAKRRQNLDHHPLDGLYPTSKWPKGKIIEDVQKVDIRADYPSGPAVPYVGFYRGKTRLKIKTESRRAEGDDRWKSQMLQVVTRGGAEGDGDGKPSHKVTTLEESPEALNLDGKLDESFWGELDALELEPFGSGPDKKTRVKLARLGESLVVGARLEDEHVWSKKKERDSNTWEEEVLELFVDTDGDGENYLELQVNPLGTIFDANFKTRLGTGEGTRSEQIDRAKEFDLEGLETAVHVEGTVNDKAKEDEFWSVELKLPLASIPGVEDADELGGTWAANFYRFDRPSEGTTLSYAWSTGPRGDFHQVSKFGSLLFDAGTSDDEQAEKEANPSSDDQVRVPEALKKNVNPKKLRRPELKNLKKGLKKAGRPVGGSPNQKQEESKESGESAAERKEEANEEDRQEESEESGGSTE